MENKISQFTFCFENDGNYYVVQTYTKRIFQIEKDVYCSLKGKKTFESDDEEIISKFTEAEIINPTHTIEVIDEEMKNKENDSEWYSLHIIPTASCNFSCDYCFVLKDKISNDCDCIISDETLYKGIDFFFKSNTADKPLVTFYGGEPLLAPNVIYKTINYIENVLKKDINKKIITNGTLVTDEIALYLAEHDFDVNVSLDGNKQAQDAFRVYNNKQSTFDDVVKGINTLKKYGNSIKILMTVGDFNANDLEVHVDTLLGLEPTTVAFNLPKALQYNDNQIEHNMNYQQLLEKYLICVNKCYEKHIPEGHMADIVFGFLRDDIQYRPCHGCGKQIALTPNGLIGPCQAYLGTKKYFSKLDSYENISELRNNPDFKKWNNITMTNCEKCQKCYLRPVCSGDCPYDWENRSNSLTDVPESYCISRKAMFDYMLHRLVTGKNILFCPNE